MIYIKNGPAKKSGAVFSLKALLDRQRFFCAYAKFQYKKPCSKRQYKDGCGNHGEKAYLYDQAYRQKGQNGNKKDAARAASKKMTEMQPKNASAPQRGAENVQSRAALNCRAFPSDGEP